MFSDSLIFGEWWMENNNHIDETLKDTNMPSATYSTCYFDKTVAESRKKKYPLGNREAVRKYREKKKARALSLEEEAVKLRAMNQQLLKKLRSQAALEAEIARLKCLLVDICGRIQGAIGSFPYQKTYTEMPSFSNCMSQNLQCLGNQASGNKDPAGSQDENKVSHVNSPGASNGKGEPEFNLLYLPDLI